MRPLRTALLLSAAVALLAAAPAAASGPRVCVPVKAQGVGQDLGGGMTTARITTHGILLGTTNAAFTPTPTGFAGPIVFTTGIGTLTAQVAGTFDPTTGVFEARSRSVTGTGAFAGVTGRVRIAGLEDLGDGTFTETITGRLCARL